jgi:predicted PurR-regulated permease PerM
VISVESSELIRNLKIVVILALIIGVLGTILYLIYGLTILWQAMAAGIITGFLSILLILFIAISVYLWAKNMLLKRELNRYKEELKFCKAKLKNAEKKSAD